MHLVNHCGGTRGLVAQKSSALDCHSKGREFESPRGRFGLVVQWLVHAAVNRGIGVRVPAFPHVGFGYFDETKISKDSSLLKRD